jgi:hypothetical protein
MERVTEELAAICDEINSHAEAILNLSRQLSRKLLITHQERRIFGHLDRAYQALLHAMDDCLVEKEGP